MKTALLSASITALWILSSAYARPSDATTTTVDGDDDGVDTPTMDKTTLKKKKIDIRRQQQREQLASDTIRRINDYISNINVEGGETGDQQQSQNNEFHIKFHNRQLEKKKRLDEMHNDLSTKLEEHHTGRNLLSNEELDTCIKKKAAIERKRKSLEEETPERYIERMKRHEEKLMKKIDRKDRRREERLKKMMDGASVAAGGGEL